MPRPEPTSGYPAHPAGGPLPPPDGAPSVPPLTEAAPPPSAAAAGAPGPVGWPAFDTLPSGVQRAVVGQAAAALPGVDAPLVPPSVRRIVRFAPAKRAQLGRAALGAALSEDGFRAAVAEAVRTRLPDLVTRTERAFVAGPAVPAADAAAAGAGADGGEPADPEVLALAWLLRLAPARHSLHVARRAAQPAADTAAEVERLSAELRAAHRRVARLEADLAGAQAAVAARDSDLREQQRRLRGAGDAARRAAAVAAERAERAERAQTQLQHQVEQLEQQVRARTAERDAAVAERDRLRADAAASAQRASLTRRAEQAKVAAALGVLQAALHGLHTELQVGGEQPADVVAVLAAAPPDPFAGVGPRGVTADDAEQLRPLLALPGVRLVVDGYNVTKSAYPERTLEEQRGRLVRDLDAVAARTGAAISVVFDGADRPAGTVAPPAARRVQALFSPRGVVADDVIVELVRAEPQGRPVVVVSTDAELGRRVSRIGVRVVTAQALIRLLGPGR